MVGILNFPFKLVRMNDRFSWTWKDSPFIIAPRKPQGGRMKKLLATILIAGSLAFVSCQKGGTTGPGGGGGAGTINEPLPLSVGNWWAYLNYETGGTKGDTTRDTIRIVGTGVVNGKNVYIGVNGNDTSYVYREGGYIFIMGHEEGSPDSVYYVMKFVKTPLSTGDSWVVTSESDTNYSFSIHATAQGTENVQTPAGNFDGAMKVEFKNIWSYSYGGQTYAETTYTYYYFADNVGMVEERDMSPDSTESYSELEAYQVE